MMSIIKGLEDLRERALTLIPLAERTASGEGNPIDVHEWREITLYLNVTAASAATGSPTLDVEILSSPDGETWYELDAFPQMTATGTQVKQLEKFGWYLKIRYVIGGDTPSVTFEVKAVFKK